MPDSKYNSSFINQVINPDHCFLCSSAGNIGDEHVFPKWLQRKHNLWDQKLILTNNSKISYRDLTIPCCTICNTTHLSRLEARISEAVNDGYEACTQLEPILIYQWMAKIYYGIIRKEATLLFDRSNPFGPNIMSEDWLNNLHTLYLFIQSIRRPLIFEPKYPFSVFVVNLHGLGEERNFDFRDSILHLTSSFRSDGIGFIVSFEDAAINQYSYGRYLKDVNGRKLHPVQFDELYARVTYQTSLLNRTPKFITSIPDNDLLPISVYMSPLKGLSNKPILDEWNIEEFAGYYAKVLETWFGPNLLEDPSFFKAPDMVSTWMTKSDGKLVLFDEDLTPI